MLRDSTGAIRFRNNVKSLVVTRATTFALCTMTLVLIFMGALVKSYEAGLSVPDWPTTYGYNMFLFPLSEWRANLFYEHTHRLVASVVGLITLFLCCWAVCFDRRRVVRITVVSALGIVILQGVLGGLTVLYLLPAYLSVAHGVLAQTFLLLLVYLAYVLSGAPDSQGLKPRGAPRHATIWAAGLTGAVWIQLVLGAITRHTESGLAIPDFPTMGAQWIPKFDASMLSWVNEWRLEQTFVSGMFLPDVAISQVAIHAAHRLWAVVVVAMYAGLIYSTWKNRKNDRGLRISSMGVGALLVMQIVLGVLSVTTMRLPIITSLHVATGAGLLAASWLCVLQTLRPSRLAEAALVGECGQDKIGVPQLMSKPRRV